MQLLNHSSLLISNVNLELGMIWKRNKYLPFAVNEFIKLAEPIIEK